MKLRSNSFYSHAEVRAHDTPNDLWMIIYNKVYNLTTFSKDHPGGMEVLFDCGGVDASEAFEDVGHSDDAVKMLEPFLIGEIELTQHCTYPKSHRHKDQKGNMAIAAKKRQKKQRLYWEKLIIYSLLILAALAFVICVGVQKMKWTHLLNETI